MSTRAHIIIAYGGRTHDEDGGVFQVRLGEHPGWGLLEDPPYYAVMEVDVPGGQEIIAETFGEIIDDEEHPKYGRGRFRQNVLGLPPGIRQKLGEPGPTLIPWGLVKDLMQDRE